MRSMITSLAAVILAAYATFGQAEVVETARMADALSGIQADDIVVFDLDNTIMAPAQTLGSDQWFEHMVSTAVKSGQTKEAAINLAIKEWIDVQLVTQVKPIEKMTPALIRRLQARGVKVMGLTARPVELAESTSRQLRSIGVNLQNDWQEPFTNNTDILLHDGVIFVGPKHVKGQIFGQFALEQNLQPKRVVFVDDKRHHNESMQAEMTKLEIPFLGHRYSAADADVRKFSAKTADAQFHAFETLGLLLTDGEQL